MDLNEFREYIRINDVYFYYFIILNSLNLLVNRIYRHLQSFLK